MNIDIYNARIRFERIKHFCGFLLALVTEIVAQRGIASVYHSYTPESHIGFWSSGYDGFWRATSFPRLIPRALNRSVYCYVAFMHEPTRFHCHEHMTNYIRAGGRTSCFRGGSRWLRKWRWGYWAKAEIDDTTLSCWQRTTFPLAVESQITVSLVFLITRPLLKRFSGLFNSFTLTRTPSSVKHVPCNKLSYKNKTEYRTEQ